MSRAGNFEGRKPQEKTQVTSLDGTAEPCCCCYPADAKSSLSPNQKNLFMHYLWANNTVDMKVKDLVEDKSLVADFVVDDIVQPQLMSRLKQIIVDLC